MTTPYEAISQMIADGETKPIDLVAHLTAVCGRPVSQAEINAVMKTPVRGKAKGQCQTALLLMPASAFVGPPSGKDVVRAQALRVDGRTRR